MIRRHRFVVPPYIVLASILSVHHVGAARTDGEVFAKMGNNGGNGLRRSLQTCTAADGFTVTSEEAFPEMNGCFEEKEVPQNGGGSRLEVMLYTSLDETSSFTAIFDLYFGYRWYAFYYRDGIIDSEHFTWACKTNEESGDLTPADESLTWECDLDGDGVYETPTATDAMISLTCGCDGGGSFTSPAPAMPASTTPAPIITLTPSPTVGASESSPSPAPTILASTTPVPIITPTPSPTVGATESFASPAPTMRASTTPAPIITPTPSPAVGASESSPSPAPTIPASTTPVPIITPTP
ncbi:unnamed protein product, partial [Pylaiella littoralis]